jgi:DNA invertase Pin-like site-specific DNA recombinase
MILTQTIPPVRRTPPRRLKNRERRRAHALNPEPGTLPAPLRKSISGAPLRGLLPAAEFETCYRDQISNFPCVEDLVRPRAVCPTPIEPVENVTGALRLTLSIPLAFWPLLSIFPENNGQKDEIVMPRKRIAAVAYLRTSSAANVGPDKDSDKRQRAAITAYAKAAGFVVVDVFNDPAVSGADPIVTRPGFAALLDRIEGNGVRLVEDASRFARELLTQELGILALIQRGVRVLTANGDDLTDSSDPSRKMMRQIAGAFHEYEKARLVAKLKAARDRKRLTGVKVEGRKAHAELRPETVKLAKRLHRERMSLREIAAELFADGHASSTGKPFTAQSIRNMIGGGAS